jgi:hypothetical protein
MSSLATGLKDMSKRTVVFVGPSLPREEVASILPDALILPPAEQGDVDYASRQLGAETVLLIDGIHTSRLPVWHKEILGVLANGGRLLGAASMGALRAVECEPWGAEPVGEIASWYQDGIVDGDDEVCLAHGDESTGYRQLSIPMVNIRATVAASKIPVERKREIIEFAKGLFYPDRTWPTICKGCEMGLVERSEISQAEVDLKAADAMQACYAALQPRAGESPRQPRYVNDGYGRVFRLNDSKVALNSGETIRLHEIAEKCPQIYAQALQRTLALEYCRMVGIHPRKRAWNADDLPYTDLTNNERVTLWNEEQTLDRGREWLVSAGSGFHEVPSMLDFLRSTGTYDAVKEK